MSAGFLTSSSRRARVSILRTRRVIEARFGLGDRDPATLEQVGTEIGVTRERVRQIETRALRELEVKNPALKDFLNGAE